MEKNIREKRGGLVKIKGAIFDMDGTIVDVPYDWIKIKAELETQGKPILIYLDSLEEPEKSMKWKILEKYEDEATKKAELKPGIRKLLSFLSRKGIKKVLVTNNAEKNVNFLLNKFHLEFDLIVSRESGLWKPSGAPFVAVLRKLGLRKKECCVVGDSHFDVQAANEAGIPYVFILNENKERFITSKVEVFSSPQELIKRLETLLEGEGAIKT
jgi:HAD superfamily hydrolase (TIGR01549 family)